MTMITEDRLERLEKGLRRATRFNRLLLAGMVLLLCLSAGLVTWTVSCERQGQYGRYALSVGEGGGAHILDTATGEVWLNHGIAVCYLGSHEKPDFRFVRITDNEGRLLHVHGDEGHITKEEASRTPHWWQRPRTPKARRLDEILDTPVTPPGAGPTDTPKISPLDEILNTPANQTQPATSPSSSEKW